MFTRFGRGYMGYSYAVDSQSQGMTADLKVIGDKKANGTSILFRRDPALVVDEIKHLNDRYGVNVVLLTDEYPTKDAAAWEEFLDRLIAEPDALAGMAHIEYVREAGSEGIELVMWLIARGAMSDIDGGKAPAVKHRFYHVPASNTAVGHLILENRV